MLVHPYMNFAYWKKKQKLTNQCMYMYDCTYRYMVTCWDYYAGNKHLFFMPSISRYLYWGGQQLWYAEISIIIVVILKKNIFFCATILHEQSREKKIVQAFLTLICIKILLKSTKTKLFVFNESKSMMAILDHSVTIYIRHSFSCCFS